MNNHNVFKCVSSVDTNPNVLKCMSFLNLNNYINLKILNYLSPSDIIGISVVFPSLIQIIKIYFKDYKIKLITINNNWNPFDYINRINLFRNFEVIDLVILPHIDVHLLNLALRKINNYKEFRVISYVETEKLQFLFEGIYFEILSLDSVCIECKLENYLDLMNFLHFNRLKCLKLTEYNILLENHVHENKYSFNIQFIDSWLENYNCIPSYKTLCETVYCRGQTQHTHMILFPNINLAIVIISKLDLHLLSTFNTYYQIYTLYLYVDGNYIDMLVLLSKFPNLKHIVTNYEFQMYKKNLIITDQTTILKYFDCCIHKVVELIINYITRKIKKLEYTI